MKQLTYLEIKAADMYARGAKEADILKECQRSRTWFRVLKKNETFRKYVNEQIDKHESEGAGKVSCRIVKSEIDIFKEDFKKGSEILYTAAIIGLEKIVYRIQNLDPFDIEPQDIPRFLDSLNRAMTTALEVRQASLGLNELLEYTDEFKKVIETRAVEFRTEESDFTGTEED